MPRLPIVLIALLLAGCDMPPTHEALYPPNQEQLSQFFIITHDRYHPWRFQVIDPSVMPP